MEKAEKEASAESQDEIVPIPQSEKRSPREELMRLVEEVEALKSKVVTTRQRTLATQTPRRRKKVGAITYYSYREGQIYELHAGVDRVTDISLQPGEELSGAPVAGDTVRWKIGSATSGVGKKKRTHIIVKPLEEGTETNLLIPTTKRTYHLRAMASDWYMPQIAWNYPEEELEAVVVKKNQESRNEPLTFSPEKLSFAYVVKGKKEPWKPIRVFDDGSKTYLQMSKELEAREAPVLFILNNGDEPRLTNYRVKGDFYIVDELFTRAELRVGKRSRVQVLAESFKPSLFERIF